MKHHQINASTITTSSARANAATVAFNTTITFVGTIDMFIFIAITIVAITTSDATTD